MDFYLVSYQPYICIFSFYFTVKKGHKERKSTIKSFWVRKVCCLQSVAIQRVLQAEHSVDSAVAGVKFGCLSRRFGAGKISVISFRKPHVQKWHSEWSECLTNCHGLSYNAVSNRARWSPVPNNRIAYFYIKVRIVLQSAHAQVDLDRLVQSDLNCLW